MRYVIIFLLCGIAVMTMPTAVLAQESDPCTGVTCHDNSKCAVRGDGKLFCVCDEGYISEPDGSGCKKKCANDGDCPNLHVCFQNRCVKKCSADGDCRNLRVCFQDRCMKRSQRLTIKSKAINLIIPGAILTAGFVALAAYGIFMLVPDAQDKEDCEIYGDCGSDPYTGLALAIFVPPLVITLAAGVPLLTVGLVKRKKIKSGELGFNINTKHGKLTLEPVFAAGENGGVFGLSGRF